MGISNDNGHYNPWYHGHHGYNYYHHPQSHPQPHFTFPSEHPTKTAHGKVKVDDIVTTIKNIVADVATNITESLVTTTENIKKTFTPTTFNNGNINTVGAGKTTNMNGFNNTVSNATSGGTNVFGYNEGGHNPFEATSDSGKNIFGLIEDNNSGGTNTFGYNEGGHNAFEATSDSGKNIFGLIEDNNSGGTNTFDYNEGGHNAFEAALDSGKDIMGLNEDNSSGGANIFGFNEGGNNVFEVTSDAGKDIFGLNDDNNSGGNNIFGLNEISGGNGNSIFGFHENRDSNQTVLVGMTETANASIHNATESVNTILTDFINSQSAIGSDQNNGITFSDFNDGITSVTGVTEEIEAFTTTISDNMNSTASNAVSLLNTTTQQVANTVYNFSEVVTSSTTKKIDWENDGNDILTHTEQHQNGQSESHQALYVILGVVLGVLLLILIILLLIYKRYKKSNSSAKYQYEITPIAGATSLKCLNEKSVEDGQCRNDVYVKQIHHC